MLITLARGLQLPLECFDARCRGCAPQEDVRATQRRPAQVGNNLADGFGVYDCWCASHLCEPLTPYLALTGPLPREALTRTRGRDLDFWREALTAKNSYGAMIA